MNEAENTEQVIETPAAEGQQPAEPMIPKHRLDDVAAQNRFLQEQIKQQQEVMEMLRQRVVQPQQQDDHSELEQLGLDQSQIKAMRKLIAQEAAQLAQPLRAGLGALAQKTEEQQFLLDHGKENAKYLGKIREMRKQYAMQNMPLDTETAFKMIRFDEYEQRSKNPAPKAEAKVEVKAPVAPPPTVKPAANQPKTLEDMEAELEERFQANGPI